jgi:excisionase family DNA binding protein
MVKMSNPFELIEQKLTAIEVLVRSLKDEKPEPKRVSYLTREETAELLKITLPTIDKYTREGIIKGSKIGSRVLYLESEIMESVKEIPVLKYRRR